MREVWWRMALANVGKDQVFPEGREVREMGAWAVMTDQWKRCPCPFGELAQLRLAPVVLTVLDGAHHPAPPPFLPVVS